MADAQDLKSWDLKQSCRFESDHRYQFPQLEFRTGCTKGIGHCQWVSGFSLSSIFTIEKFRNLQGAVEGLLAFW